MIHKIRGWVLPFLLLLTLLFGFGALLRPGLWLGAAATGALFLLGLHDLLQRKHAILRTYPVLGHMRFLLEDSGPELRQYIVESNTEGRPFNRDQRSLMYQRAKGVLDKKAFGTELDVYREGYSWIAHSMSACEPPERAGETLRVSVGGAECAKPYDASVFNISAMSFGSLSPDAVRALNTGAQLGDFAHNTGEGGVSRYHREPGGDLIWQIGTGYFGCRNDAGRFDEDLFKASALLDNVRMIEIKLSQGAKPGHGGILPAAKISREIAETRGVARGQDCVSPPRHNAFATPIELLEFVARLRELSGGKPVGVKLCVGDPVDWLAVCKAMVATNITPDFVTVDGAEGGTGAAPVEFADHIGLPVREGIVMVHNALCGIGVRDRVRVQASGKLVTGFEMSVAFALGADMVASARGFMFALGCIQAQRCHTNTCPVGVATQHPWLRRALVVEDKSVRVRNFHHKTVQAMAEVVAAAGFEHPDDLGPEHVYERISPWEIRTLRELYHWSEPGQLLAGKGPEFMADAWRNARAEGFRSDG